ncbi:MAG TPA: hypothetical protein VFR90_06245 [Methylibium sp.]|uniref:hypothetical protein n=1 Tax=Methylibium sp. TaxID=2067992 RepID=UPI002DBE0FB8|nr:hypothetical protein [Methylibium sp.]HEU4458706.1 hypothetical protein [Methylibium sp.]
MSLPDDLLGFGLVFLFAAAMWLPLRCGTAVLRTVLVIGSVPAVVVLLRVIFDVARNPTTHNLWPLEVAIAGAVLGQLLRGSFGPVGD